MDSYTHRYMVVLAFFIPGFETYANKATLTNPLQKCKTLLHTYLKCFHNYE